jgi:hypothetical protein
VKWHLEKCPEFAARARTNTKSTASDEGRGEQIRARSHLKERIERAGDPQIPKEGGFDHDIVMIPIQRDCL